jgi:hypothetical protein
MKSGPRCDSWADVLKKRAPTVSNLSMMARPTDKPMARAQAHLAAGRYAEAAGAFRAVLAIDSSALPARLGLADAVAGRGQRRDAVDGLVEAAETCAELRQHAAALCLYGKALVLEPTRMELHLDVAVVEHAMGHSEAALARVEGLAERYISTGRTEEAAELLRFAATWDDEGIEEIDPEELGTVEPEPRPTARAAKPAPQLSTETVVCATVLIRPDGTLWFGQGRSPAVPELDEAELTVARAVSAPIVLDELEEDADPDMVTRVASPPAAPPRRSPIKQSSPLAHASANPLVERLRRRAGLEPEAVAVPRSTKARGTEPIAVRHPNLKRPEREQQEEVTHRFRRPRSLGRAAAL